MSELNFDEIVKNFKVDESSIHKSITHELANKRQGTSSSKGRSDVKGSNKKPWAQKGTGKARAGSVKSPIWRGGGVIFGPKPRKYKSRLSKKVKKIAMRSLFVKFFNEGRIKIIKKLDIKESKTKKIFNKFYEMEIFDNIFSNLKNNKLKNKIRNSNFILIVKDINILLKRGIKNLPCFKYLFFDKLNIYDLFYSDKIIIEEEILANIYSIYFKKSKE